MPTHTHKQANINKQIKWFVQFHKSWPTPLYCRTLYAVDSRCFPLSHVRQMYLSLSLLEPENGQRNRTHSLPTHTATGAQEHHILQLLPVALTWRVPAALLQFQHRHNRQNNELLSTHSAADGRWLISAFWITYCKNPQDIQNILMAEVQEATIRWPPEERPIFQHIGRNFLGVFFGRKFYM